MKARRTSDRDQPALLPGTLAVLNLRILIFGSQHGRRAQLVRQSSRWRRLIAAMARVLGPDMANG